MNLSEPNRLQESISPHQPLYPFQRQVLRDLLDVVTRGALAERRVVAHLPTGAGKTRIASHVAAALLNRRECEGKVLVWLAASEELCEQAAESLAKSWQALGNRSVRISRFWGAGRSDLSEIGEGFLIAGLQKLWGTTSRRLRKGESSILAGLSRRIAGIVFDEAHQAIAPTYRHVTENLALNNPPLLGLTATPGRTWRLDGNDYDLAEMFGERKVTIDPRGHGNPVTYLIRQGYLADPQFDPVTVALKVSVNEPKGTSDYSDADLRAIGGDRGWNDTVIELATKALAEHSRVMVFCPSVQCALEAASALSNVGLRAAAIVADTPADTRHAVISDFRDISGAPMALFSYGVLTAGFDAPRTRCVIVARPTASLVLYSQMVGRAMRGPRSGGNVSCQIYTITDTSLRGFGSVAEAFTNWEELWQMESS